MDEKEENSIENTKKVKAILEVQEIENNAESIINRAKEEADKKIKNALDESAKKILTAKTTTENEKKAYIDRLVDELNTKANKALTEAKEKAAKIRKMQLSKKDREKIAKELVDSIL